MYTYYKKINVDHQMLFDSEIARLYKIYKIQDKKDFGEVVAGPYFVLVKKVIFEYIEENNIELDELYYPTYSGMGMVFPEHVYKHAIEKFLKEHSTYDVTQIYTSKDGKRYKFAWIKDRV